MTTEQKIIVMRACVDGKAIQFSELAVVGRGWQDLGPHCALWNWDRYDFRIKPQQPAPRPVEGAGYEHTQEYREPAEGEYFYNDTTGQVEQGDGIPFDGPCYILRKIEPTLEERIAREYGHLDVVMLGWRVSGRSLVMVGMDHMHVDAQSMKGFYKYVYERGDQLVDSGRATISPANVGTVQPVAVLFYREAASDEN